MALKALLIVMMVLSSALGATLVLGQGGTGRGNTNTKPAPKKTTTKPKTPSAAAPQRQPDNSAAAIPTNTMLHILRAEDQRRWDDNLKLLLSDKNAKVRQRTALAAGRIGDERALPALAELLKKDADNDVRQMAAFAIGEVESFAGADTLYRILSDTSEPREISARAVEALGKIAAALPDSDKEHRQEIGKAILGVLSFEADPRVSMDRLTAQLGLTAALRAKPEGAGVVVVKFLKSRDPRIVADALNTMARLRLKDNNEEVRGLLKHADPIVRANAARVSGAAEDKGAFDALLDRALHDDDLRVRVSALRALGSLKDMRAVEPLLKRGDSFLQQEASAQSARNELLEIATTLGRLLPNSSNDGVVAFLDKMHNLTRGEAVEVEVAMARVVPVAFQSDRYQREIAKPDASWRQASSRAQGLAAIREVLAGAATGNAADTAVKVAQREIMEILRRPETPTLAIPDVLQAYNSFKPPDAVESATKWLQSADVIVRATAAEVLGNQSPGEANSQALIKALAQALGDKDLNDAALAILDALGKQKNAAANEAIKTALDSSDHLIRRRAVTLLKANGAGDFSSRVGTVQTRNAESDYRRAIARIGKKVTATVVTTKGSFVIEFLPEDSPLTVDNFVMLARRGYFNGQTVPRVVPNFVIQTGDPRGDQNGGPGYSIRCEINEAPYDRAAVGMALSGKDTGGSQWFVTHSPQPHLDGGYTVFGRVISGMDVVDRIARGDTIRRVVVNER
jgi:cyclophilin family peptidyl-prolyl cis-trans isomerase/HEAT repeat protein